MTNKKQRGQFFTTNEQVQKAMMSLITHTKGNLLEPSAGAGDLLISLEEKNNFSITAVELDRTIKGKSKTPILNQDFFVFADKTQTKYDVIYGNPPYVAAKSLEPSTRASAGAVKARYSEKSNLYHWFIDRSIDLLSTKGELIFIVPKEWLFTSSAAPLRSKMLDQGAITHLIDCGEEKLFQDADVPALLIFRYVRGIDQGLIKFASTLEAANLDLYEDRELESNGSRFLLLKPTTKAKLIKWGTLGDSFSVKVGIVTGIDDVFRLREGIDVEASTLKVYLTTKGLQKFIDVNHIDDWKDMPPKAAKYLRQHKNRLMNRKITLFTESNWWKYGAIRNQKHMLSKSERFYAIVKTRSETPFFENSKAKVYGGGILGIFKDSKSEISVATAVKVLNSPAYWEVLEAMFLTSGNKVSLQPATLEDAPFPKTEADAKTWLDSQPEGLKREIASIKTK